MCPLCNMDIGDEYHYLMKCDAFNYQRSFYIPKFYYESPNTVKFNNLMSSTHKKNSSLFSETYEVDHVRFQTLECFYNVKLMI